MANEKNSGGGSISDRRYKKEHVKTSARRKIGSTRWLERQLNDPYVQEARRLGLRSRAAFKLRDVQAKYRLMKATHNIVDLGCAPGGWVQVALENIGSKGHVVGMDLLEVEPIGEAIMLQGDFTDVDAPDRLKTEMKGKANGVLSDMASNTTGHKPTDHIRIMALVEMAAYFAFEVLEKDGYFVAKVFSGGTENGLLLLLKKHFVKVHHFKPPSSRKDSAEMYVIATGFKDNYNGIQ